MEHCGIDLHLKSSEVCVVDEAGRVAERARIPTTEKGFRRWFGGREGMRVCIEASGLSPWVGRILAELGHEVIVANAQRVRLIAESTLKNDTVDAETLARLEGYQQGYEDRKRRAVTIVTGGPASIPRRSKP